MIGGNLLAARRHRAHAALDDTGLGRVLEVFGQAPLAFYIAHLWLFAVVGIIGYRQGASYGVVYSIWLVGLVPLYVFTRWYGRRVGAKPAASAWRYF